MAFSKLIYMILGVMDILSYRVEVYNTMGAMQETLFVETGVVGFAPVADEIHPKQSTRRAVPFFISLLEYECVH